MQDINVESVPPGTTHRQLITPKIDHAVELPCHIVRGAHPGPTLLVTAGVHGAEYASIEAANQLGHADPNDLKGTLIVLPIVNPPSFFARSIYVNPIDGKNLNRMFPGRADGSFTEQLAYWLSESCVKQADAYIDLHGGDLIEALTPFVIYQANDVPAKELAEVFGLPYLTTGQDSGMSIRAGAAHGVPSLLAEAGGQGQWPEESVRELTSGVRRVMQHLGMLAGHPELQNPQSFSSLAWLRAEGSGFWYPQVKAGDTVEPGQDLGRVTDLFGETLQQARSSQNGTVLFLVSSLAINKGDPLVGIGVQP